MALLAEPAGHLAYSSARVTHGSRKNIQTVNVAGNVAVQSSSIMHLL